MNWLRKTGWLQLAIISITLSVVSVSCTSIDLYEKAVSIPGHAWASSFKPSFDFTIKDSSAPYQVFLVMRHNEKYRFTNVVVNLYIKSPGKDSAIKIQRDILLATNEGWLGKGMDDIYEERRELGDPIPLKPGTYHFTVEQIMREDPLENVLNVGLRVEKK